MEYSDIINRYKDIIMGRYFDGVISQEKADRLINKLLAWSRMMAKLKRSSSAKTK